MMIFLSDRLRSEKRKTKEETEDNSSRVPIETLELTMGRL